MLGGGNGLMEPLATSKEGSAEGSGSGRPTSGFNAGGLVYMVIRSCIFFIYMVIANPHVN